VIFGLLSFTSQEAPLYREVKTLKYSETSIYRSIDQFPIETSLELQENYGVRQTRNLPDSITIVSLAILAIRFTGMSTQSIQTNFNQRIWNRL